MQTTLSSELLYYSFSEGQNFSMESTVRSRPSRSKNAKGEKKIEAENKPEENDSSWMLSRSYLLYVLMPLIVLAVSAGLTLYAARTSSSPKAPKESRKDAKLTLFTEDELAKHDGSDPSLPIYIVVLGRVYDVEKGRKHYAPESGYNVFAGRDSTPSFVTGVFSREEATDDVSALSPEEMMGVKDWMDFYRKDYTYVGRLVGRYYDSHGEPTPALLQARQKIKEGQRLRKLQEGENKRFPGCNSRWSQDEGSTVWCTNERSVCFFVSHMESY